MKWLPLMLFVMVLPAVHAAQVESDAPGGEMMAEEGGADGGTAVGASGELTWDVVHEAWERYEREHAPWPAGSEAAEAFTETAVSFVVSRIGTRLEDVRQQWGRLSAEERDAALPMAIYASVRASQSLSGEWGAIQWLDASIKAFLESGGSHLRCAAAANRLAQLQDAWNKDEEAAASYKLSLEQFQLAAAEPGINGLEQRYVLTKLPEEAMDFLPVEWLDAYFEQLRADERIDPWLRDMVLGRWHVKAGWRARGSGYARTVTDEGWRTFGERLQRARKHLERAYEASPDRPESARGMITVAMAGHAAPGETERTWFERATAAQFDYTPAYHSMSYALRPRWGGSIESMVRFGLQCAATERYDTVVPLFLIEALIDVCEEMEDFDAVWKQRGIYPAVKKALEGSIAHPNHAHRVERLRTQLAVAAWKAGEYQDAAAQLKQVSALKDDWLEDFNVHAEELINDVFARTGKAADTVRRADRAAARGDWATAVSLLESAVGRRTFVDDRLAIALFMQRYESGEWTPLVGTKAGWRFAAGSWQVRGDRLVARESGGHMLAIFGAPVGRRFEMEVLVDATETASPSWAGGGIAFLYSDRTQSPQYWALRASPNESRSVTLGRRTYNTCNPKKVATTGTDQLTLVLWDDWVRATVNGEVVFQGWLPLRDGDHPGDRIGLTSRRTLDKETLAFSGARIRKLTVPPAAMLEMEWAEEDKLLQAGQEEGPEEESREDSDSP